MRAPVSNSPATGSVGLSGNPASTLTPSPSSSVASLPKAVKRDPSSSTDHLPWDLHATVADWDMASAGGRSESDNEVTFHPSHHIPSHHLQANREEWSWMSDGSQTEDGQAEFSTPERRVFDTQTGAARRQAYIARYGEPRCITPEGLRSSRPVNEVELVPKGQISPIIPSNNDES